MGLVEKNYRQTLESIVSKAQGRYLSPKTSKIALCSRLACSGLEGLKIVAHGTPYVYFEMRPLTKRSMWNETAPTATALSLRGNDQTKFQQGGQALSRICVWLEKLQPKTGKPLVELTRQPWA